MRHYPAVTVALSLSLSIALCGCGEATSSADAASDVATPVSRSGETASEYPSSPEAAVSEMLRLARAGEWGAYVDRFYGEQHKFRPGHDDRSAVADRLARSADRIVAGLEEASDARPVVSEDGATATFPLSGGAAFTLFRAADGRWTFHL